MATRYLFLDESIAPPHARRNLACAWLTAGLAVTGVLLLRPFLASYTWMWLMVGVILVGCKGIVLARHAGSVAAGNPGRLLAFLFPWPGLNWKPFASANRGPLLWKPLAAWGTANVLAGSLLLWGVTRFESIQAVGMLHGWVGLIGMSLVAHFGVLQLLAAFWRNRGVPVAKLWDFPLQSKSLAEFWSLRWNRAFHHFTRDEICLPLRRRFGPATALLAGFTFSGLLHELVISVPALGGYGFTTLYFLIQAAGVFGERRLPRQTPDGIRRLWTVAFVIGPVGLVFHPPFLHNVVLPFLSAIGAA